MRTCESAPPCVSNSLHAFLSMCTSIECCFRPFASVHAQWIAASVHSDSCNAEMLSLKLAFSFGAIYFKLQNLQHTAMHVRAPSQAFMLSGLLLPSIRIHATPKGFSNEMVAWHEVRITRFSCKRNPTVAMYVRDTFRICNTQQCTFVLLCKRSCSVDCWLPRDLGTSTLRVAES